MRSANHPYLHIHRLKVNTPYTMMFPLVVARIVFEIRKED